MGVQCQILINKTKYGVHRAGEAVTGKVRYTVDEPTEYRHVTLSFLGKGKCVWRQGSSKNRRTYRGSEDYIITHVNVYNKRPNDTITLEGRYEHPFEFFLPEDIPRSHKDNIGCISYRIELKFEKPSFFSFNKVFTAEIPVHSYLKPTVEGPVVFGLQKELFAPFAPTTPVINLKAEIDKTLLTPGQNAHISYKIKNDTDVEIISLRTELYCYTTYTANNGKKKHLESKVKFCEAWTKSIPKRQEQRYTCLLPTLPTLCTIKDSKVISVEYKVRAIVRLPMPHMDAVVNMPVLIGEMKEATELAVEALEDEEQPPSYWEVMNEGEKKEEHTDDESD